MQSHLCFNSEKTKTFSMLIFTHNKSFFSIIFLFCFLFPYTETSAQFRKNDLYSNDSLFTIPLYETPRLNNDSLVRMYDTYSKFTPSVLAELCEINISTKRDGNWIKNADNSHSWFVRVKSVTAFNLSFIVENIALQKGSFFYVLNTKQKICNGPYSSKNADQDSSMYIEPIPGDDLILELDVPAYNDRSKNNITIKKVGHDFRDFYNESKKRGTTESCEHDINCGIGLDWQKEKRAIVKYTYPFGTKIYGCTGTLINNTSNNEIPYIITANHCIKDAKTASQAVFYFNYENSSCGKTDANLTHSLSGSQLIATSKDTSANLDFTLLRLNKSVPSTFLPYFVGWTLKKDPDSKVVTLHHPNGEPLKISYDKDLIKYGSYPYATDGYMFNCHWQILEWDTGVTEPRSSGCPLFNSKHQLIGTLTGGDAKCGSPYNDFFEKFYISWDYFADTTNQLKYWLDPLHNGVTECSSFDPIVGNGNPITNVSSDEELKIYNFNKRAKGFWTGYNEPGLKKCADKYTGIKNQYIYAIRFPIQVFKKTADLHNLTLTIWTGINHPDSILFEQTLSIDSITNGYYTLRLKNRIKTGSDYFIGFDFSNITISDSICLFTTKNRTNKSNSLYYFYRNQWIQSINLGLYSSLGIEVYATDNISPTQTIEFIPEKLKRITFNTIDTLQTNELFKTDSIVNFDYNNWLLLQRLTDDKGYWTGSNSVDINQYAEKINSLKKSYISGLKFAIAKNTITDSTILLSVLLKSDLQKPDSVYLSKEIKAINLKENYNYVLKFKQPIFIDSSFYIVLNTENIPKTDTFAVYMGTPKDVKNSSHSFYFSNQKWTNYSVYNIVETICFGAQTWYSPFVFDKDSEDYRYVITNKIRPTNEIFKKFYIYPNPSSGQNREISINFGYTKVKTVFIDFTDILGRKINTTISSITDNNSVIIPTQQFSPGIYYMKMTIDGTVYSTVPLIILH